MARRSRSTERFSRSELILRAVYVLGDGDERNTVSAERLAKHVHMTPGTLVALVDRLAAAGMVDRSALGVRISAAGLLALGRRASRAAADQCGAGTGAGTPAEKL